LPGYPPAAEASNQIDTAKSLRRREGPGNPVVPPVPKREGRWFLDARFRGHDNLLCPEQIRHDKERSDITRIESGSGLPLTSPSLLN
jgi:hypothetical protein